MPRTALFGTSLHPQCRKTAVKGAASLSTGHSVAHCCTLSDGKSRLRGQQHASYDSLRHIHAPSYAEIQCRGGNSMPRTTLCGTFMHPHMPKYSVEGATACLALLSVTHPCTLSARKSRLRGRQTTVQGTRWHGAAPSVTKKQGLGCQLSGSRTPMDSWQGRCCTWWPRGRWRVRPLLDRAVRSGEKAEGVLWSRRAWPPSATSEGGARWIRVLRSRTK